MKFWERFLFNRIPHSRFDGGDNRPLMNDPEMQDIVSDAEIDKVANNGDTTKRLLARFYIENNNAHKDIRKKQEVHGAKIGFCNRFMWIIITVFTTGFIGGMIAIIVEIAKRS